MDVIDAFGMRNGYRIVTVGEALEGCECVRRERIEQQQRIVGAEQGNATGTPDAQLTFEQKQMMKEQERRKQERLEDKKRKRELKRLLKEEKEERKKKLQVSAQVTQPQQSTAPSGGNDVRAAMRAQWLERQKRQHEQSTTTTTTNADASPPNITTTTSSPPQEQKSPRARSPTTDTTEKVQKLSPQTEQSTDRPCLVQIRMPNGETTRLSFSQSDAFEQVILEVQRHESLIEDREAFSIMTPFPRHVIPREDWERSIGDVLGGAPRVSLVVQLDSQKGELKRGTAPHVPAPGPVAPMPGPGVPPFIGLPYMPPGGHHPPAPIPHDDDNMRDTDQDELNPGDDNEKTNWTRLMVREWHISPEEATDGFVVYRPEGHRILEELRSKTQERRIDNFPESLHFLDEEYVEMTPRPLDTANSMQKWKVAFETRTGPQQMVLYVGKKEYIVHVVTNQALILKNLESGL